ncbi:MAG: TetR/AcrR family transcriptional regulator [Dehalococcoidia bacterium]
MRADARRNYQRLLAEAKAAFAEHGPDASLDDIARRAGVGIGTLYRHFPTRLALQEAVIREQTDALRARAEELLASPSPGDALAIWLRANLALASMSHGLGGAVMNTMLDGETGLSSSCTLMSAAAEALLVRAQQSGVVRADADIASVLRLANAIALATLDAPDRAAQSERLLSLVLDGLRHQAPTAT